MKSWGGTGFSRGLPVVDFDHLLLLSDCGHPLGLLLHGSSIEEPQGEVQIAFAMAIGLNYANHGGASRNFLMI
jgi:hypothetical protein